jgi:hypothetical protein
MFDRIRKISTPDMLDSDEKEMYDCFIDNGYPSKFIDKYSKPSDSKPILFSVPKKNIFLHLPFKGDDVSLNFKRRLTGALQRTYYAAKLVFIEETTNVPTSPRKDPVDSIAKSNLIYGFTCSCGSSYAGRTSRQLGKRINEHIPKWLLSTRVGTSRTAITKHLQDTGHTVNISEAFRIIYTPKLKQNLRFAEAVAIRIYNPILCVQKQMVTNLLLPWN